MSFFPSLSDEAGVVQVLGTNAAAGRALIELHTAALRNESQLDAAEKELIAAYVSGLNACQYCYGVHSQTAAAFGIDEAVLQALLHDVETAPVPDSLKPMLRYARKLTREPAKIVRADAEAVFAAGWKEAALHDAVLTVALFNFMNRLVEGHGIKGDTTMYASRGKALKESGYAPLADRIGKG